jgi:hypothetical protein
MKNYNTDIYKFLNNQVLEKRQMFHAKWFQIIFYSS